MVQESFEAKGDAITTDPLAVLTDDGSASASEILAGARIVITVLHRS